MRRVNTKNQNYQCAKKHDFTLFSECVWVRAQMNTSQKHSNTSNLVVGLMDKIKTCRECEFSGDFHNILVRQLPLSGGGAQARLRILYNARKIVFFVCLLIGN